MAAIELKGGERLREFLRKARSSSGVKGVKVGFFSEATYDDDLKTPVAAVAAANEFGVQADSDRPAIPERPFFRRSLQSMETDVVNVMRSGVDTTTMRIDSRTWELVGQAAQSHIQRQIETSGLWAKPNSPRTIQMKGSEGPLRDTGLMRNSVTYIVER